MHLLTTAPAQQRPLGELFDWCRGQTLSTGQKLITKYDQFRPLREEALKWARIELETRKRHEVGIAAPQLTGSRSRSPNKNALPQRPTMLHGRD